MKAAYCRYILRFYVPAITSRATMLTKETYFVKIWNEKSPDIYGIGECALFRGLSDDDTPEYEPTLAHICRNINIIKQSDLNQFSSIKFGIETAIKDLNQGGKHIICANSWSAGKSEIQINGLVWMGSFDDMYMRINEKIKAGFHCIKLKVGGIDFTKELELIKFIRSCFDAKQLELRLDANGAFTCDNALDKLNKLAKYDIHSIEQPIKAGQWSVMSKICNSSPIPIALDEELIGINSVNERESMIDKIKPQYIILKPALCGGLSGADEWIALAQDREIGWWATSALESNIGLNAIAQWVASYNLRLPQGLGTGQLYTNNITSPLVQERDILRYNSHAAWEIPSLNWVNQ